METKKVKYFGNRQGPLFTLSTDFLSYASRRNSKDIDWSVRCERCKDRGQFAKTWTKHVKQRESSDLSNWNQSNMGEGRLMSNAENMRYTLGLFFAVERKEELSCFAIVRKFLRFRGHE